MREVWRVTDPVKQDRWFKGRSGKIAEAVKASDPFFPLEGMIAVAEAIKNCPRRHLTKVVRARGLCRYSIIAPATATKVNPRLPAVQALEKL